MTTGVSCHVDQFDGLIRDILRRLQHSLRTSDEGIDASVVVGFGVLVYHFDLRGTFQRRRYLVEVLLVASLADVQLTQ